MRAIFGLVALLSLFISISLASSPWDDYIECRDKELFGSTSLICDPEHKLQKKTVRRLDSLLRELQV